MDGGHSDDTRGRLLAAARDVYLESGEAGFSLREVARRVGVSAAAVYRHFDDKRALVGAACAQGFEVFASYLVKALAAPTPHARLLETGEQYRHFALQNPLDYQFLFMRAVSLDDPQPLSQSLTFRMLVDRVSECMDGGLLARARPEEVAVLIWVHVHGLVSLRLAGHLDSVGSDPSFERFYSHSVTRLLAGLR